MHDTSDRASDFRPIRVRDPTPERPAHGRQTRRQPVRPAPRPHDARVGTRDHLAGAVRAAGPVDGPPWTRPCVAVPPARNPRPDVPILPQPSRRCPGSRHDLRLGDSMRLPLPHVRHGVRPRLLDAAHDRDGVEHARRSMSAARGRSRQSSQERGYRSPKPRRRYRDCLYPSLQVAVSSAQRCATHRPGGRLRLVECDPGSWRCLSGGRDHLRAARRQARFLARIPRHGRPQTTLSPIPKWLY